jgi:uncharacterized damage-inducible protein DinB
LRTLTIVPLGFYNEATASVPDTVENKMSEDRNDFRRLFNFDAWANREVLDSFQNAGQPTPRSLRLMAHVLGAEYLWISRIQGAKSPLAVWPELTVAECDQQGNNLIQLWSDYLDSTTSGELSRVVPYTNSKGERWSNSVEDILMHVILHSAYHRGQIASDMRAAGHTPAYTDFIHGVRQKLIG